MMCPVKRSDRFRRIENSLVGINLGYDLFPGDRRFLRALRFLLGLFSAVAFTSFGFSGAVFSGKGRGVRDERVDGAELWPRTFQPALPRKALRKHRGNFSFRFIPGRSRFALAPPSLHCPPASPAGKPFRTSSCPLQSRNRSASPWCAPATMSTCVFRLNTEVRMMISMSGVCVSGRKVVNFTP